MDILEGKSLISEAKKISMMSMDMISMHLNICSENILPKMITMKCSKRSVENRTMQVTFIMHLPIKLEIVNIKV